jgi:uncharacterized protein YqjF (DUF2071 family)
VQPSSYNTFLSARWEHLLVANYVCAPQLLLPYLPAGVELDLFQGQCLVSLVGFMFLDTKVLGLPIPFHRNFEEVNLRFYVKQVLPNETRRGVVFIKEIVPKPAIAWVARKVYHEHYMYRPMQHHIQNGEHHLNVGYSWQQGEDRLSFAVVADQRLEEMKAGSEAEFILEHYWGYTRIDERTTYGQVAHPRWLTYPVMEFSIEGSFGQEYGKEWEEVIERVPQSVFLAQGSRITVGKKHRIA